MRVVAAEHESPLRAVQELGGAKEGPAAAGYGPAVLPGSGNAFRGHGGHSGRGGGGGDDRCYLYSGGRRPYNRGWTPRSKRRN